MSDLALLIPELTLSGAAVALILVARRIQTTRVAESATLIASVTAAVASCWILSSGGDRTAFGGMVAIDGYSQFFRVLIAATLAVTTRCPVFSMNCAVSSRSSGVAIG